MMREDSQYFSQADLSSSHDNRDEVKEIRKLSQKETQQVNFWRLLVSALLFVTGLAVTSTSYKFLKRDQKRAFEVAFDQMSGSLASASVEYMHNLRRAAANIARDATIYAKGTKQKWPFFTYDHFEERAQAAVEQGGMEVLSIHPKVTAEQYDDYIEYITERYERVAAEARKVNPVINATFQPVGYTPFMSAIPGKEPDIEREAYWPMWHLTPPQSGYFLFNWNLASLPDFETMVEAMVHLRNESVFTPIRPYASEEGWYEEHRRFHNYPDTDPNEFPHSFYWTAIYEEVDDYDSEIVGAIASSMAWDIAMQNLIPEGVDGIHCIVKNSLDQTVSYVVNGPRAKYIADVDIHDSKYDHMRRQVSLSPHSHPDFLKTDGHVTYELFIYPTDVFFDLYHSWEPELFAFMVAATFLLVAVIYFIYDMVVQRRNTKLIFSAANSNEIVSSMFPEQIRDRLIGPVAEDNSKARNLKSFLHGKGEVDGESKPLADLFLDTTILCASIVGFAAWSSTREPSQVFALLETIFRQFDMLAKRRRVFKVETVADCFIAATGLPEAQEDHSVRMVQFAFALIKKMKQLSRKLEATFGPDTAELSIRIGIHTGPVTAGVLRGVRPRFQLFGDTMSTAKKIEESSSARQILVSKTTAEDLRRLGKEAWLAKGRDLLGLSDTTLAETYSINKGQLRRIVTERTEEHSVSGKGLPEDSTSRESVDGSGAVRLIDWNVQMLLGLLKQIVARREALNATSLVLPKSLRPRSKQTKAVGAFLLDEVQEIIHLPDFDQKAASRQRNPEEIKIPGHIVDALVEYVTTVSSMYRNNSFHNFEHASHVVLSVMKLLSRIVAPSDSEGEFGQRAAKLHDHTYGITSNPLTHFACAFTAMIHDAEHTGVPNTQLVKEDKDLGKQFKNRSVAEQNSFTLCWNLLHEDRFSALRETICASESELSHFRQLVLNLTLATDITDKGLKELRNGRWNKAFKNIDPSESHRESVNRKATIVLEHLIQASDVSHTMQHWHVYRKWNERFFFECYSAYKAGRSDTDPSENWYEGELGFFDFYIIPLAKKLKECGIFGISSDEYLGYAMTNRLTWENSGREIVAEMLEAYARKVDSMSFGEELDISIGDFKSASVSSQDSAVYA